MKRYFTFSTTSGLKFLDRMVQCHIHDTRWALVALTPCRDVVGMFHSPSKWADDNLGTSYECFSQLE